MTPKLLTVQGYWIPKALLPVCPFVPGVSFALPPVPPLEPSNSSKNQFILSIHDVYTSIGKTCKELLPEERQFGRREGIYATKNIKKGEKFTSDNLCIKRPALGLRSRYIDAIQGACAKINIAADNPISWDHIEF